MSTEHPITPPRELVGEWLCQDGYPWDPDLLATITITTGRLRHVATQAARWGADQELEACCEWVHETFKEGFAWCSELRDLRRPKPPSLKQQALDGLRSIECNFPQSQRAFEAACENIRRALEALPDD